MVTYEESNQEIGQAPTQAPDLHQLSDRLNYNLNELEHIKEFINSLRKNNSTSIQDPVAMANLGKCLHLKKKLIALMINQFCGSWTLEPQII